jgi:hypothetical protein
MSWGDDQRAKRRRENWLASLFLAALYLLIARLFLQGCCI